MAQSRKLAMGHPNRPVMLFTRNRLCALARNGVGLALDNFLDRLLDNSVRLATSAPGADPGGDHTWAMFALAETVHPGAQAILQAKALKLVGGRLRHLCSPATVRAGRVSRRPSRRDAGLLQRCRAGDP
jgi:molybdate transport system substrate-binding protein